MRLTYKLLLTGIAIIGILDILGSIASRQMNFNYANLAPFSLGVYCGLGFLFCRKTNMKTTVFLIAVLGLFDATIGWEICMLLGAKTGMPEGGLGILAWALMAVFMMAYGAFCGFIGGGLYQLSGRIAALKKK